MRMLFFFTLLAACGNDAASTTTPMCPLAFEQVGIAQCRVGVDTSCRSQVGDYDCFCLCTGYWECDLVAAICDAGIDLAPHD